MVIFHSFLYVYQRLSGSTGFGKTRNAWHPKSSVKCEAFCGRIQAITTKNLGLHIGFPATKKAGDDICCFSKFGL